MVRIKSARHHWWPETVSRYWQSSNDGCTGWLRPDGTVKRLPSKHLGVIGNGHNIKLSENPAESTFWDSSYESDFDLADSSFQSIVEWLMSLEACQSSKFVYDTQFVPLKSTDEQLKLLSECVVSLAVRSPVTRDSSVLLAQEIRGEMSEREKNVLIGFNMRGRQRAIADSIGARGKFIKVWSNDREFVFGDGFFHNFIAPSILPVPKLFVPLTPHLAVLYVRPSRYLVEPKLLGFEACADLVDDLNKAIHVYAKDAIHFRDQLPPLLDCYVANKHFRFASDRNPIDELIAAIPGAWN